MPGNTVYLHRIFTATPDRLYRAFTEPAAFARWLPPKGYTATVHEQNVSVGGQWRMSFTNFTTGSSHSFGGKYIEVEPNTRLRYSARFDAPGPAGEMTTTLEIRPVVCGVEAIITQEGIPAEIPVEMCYLGWQESLTFLAALIEPEIPDQ